MVSRWKEELIGSEIEVVSSKNKSLIGVKGKVMEETKNTLKLDNGKTILKSHVTIKIGDKIINGEKIQKRPEDRIKK